MNITIRFITFLFSFWVMQTTQSWAQYQIKGRLQDELNNHRPDALVMAYSNDSLSILVQSTISNDEGNFSLTLPKEAYWLQIEFNNKLVHEQLLIVEKDTDLGIIKISESVSEELASFTFKGRRPQLKLESGKMIFTPGMESAGSAFDILKTAPTLLTTESSIEIIGKGAPIIMINGKRQRMNPEQTINYLQSLPASQVERIEIVRTPGAEIDADNTYGTLNIILKGTQDKGWKATAFGNYLQSTYPSYSTGFNFYMNAGKWQYSLNASILQRKYLREGFNEIYFPTQRWKDNENRIYNNRNKYLSGSVDYDITKNQSIGFNFNTSFSPSRNTEYSPTSIVSHQQPNVIDSSLLTTAINPESLNNFTGNLNYLIKIDTTGKQFRLDAEYFWQTYDRQQDFVNYRFDKTGVQQGDKQEQISGNIQQMYITALNAGLELPYKWAHISLGGKLTFVNNNNKTSFYNLRNGDKIADLSRFDNFRYSEQIQALYTKISHSFRKWSAHAGLRAENTLTRGISDVYQIHTNNQYFKLYPSANISYRHNADHQLSLDYSRNIARPYFFQVNPFRWYHNQYAFTHGNPSLQPSFSNAINFTYLYKQCWTFIASHDVAHQVAMEITLPDDNNFIRETVVDNAMNQTQNYLGVIYQKKWWNWWFFYPQLGLNRVHTQITDYNIDNTQSLYISASLYQQFTLNKQQTFFLDLNTYYYSPRQFAYMNIKTMWAQSLTLTYNMWGKKLQFLLSANDIFRTSAMRYTSVVNGILRNREVYNDQRNVNFTIRYNLTNGQLKQRKNQSDFNDDVRNRTRG